jgi:tetratricopeptide (TPR) repeat protein
MVYGSANAQAFRALSGRIVPSVVSVIAYDAEYGTLAEGSGFFVAEGRVVTARHLLAGAASARVMLAGGAVHDVLGLLGEDPRTGLAMLAVDIPDGTAKPLPLARGAVKQGERVAIFGGRLAAEREGLEGIVSAVREVPFLGRVCTLTCGPSPEATGCPVVGMDGEIVGIAISRTVEGGPLAYAVPAERIEAIPADQFVKIGDRAKSPAAGDPTRFLPGVRALLADDLEAAHARFRELVEKDTRDGPAWKACADCLVALGRGRQAVDAAQASVSLTPDSADAWESLGAACIEAGLYKEAVDACRKVVSMRPTDPRAINRLGVACYDAGKSKEAAEVFRDAIRARPDDSQVHKNLGVALFAQGRWQEAVEAFRDAVRIQPDFEQAWKDLALCHFRLGSLEKAVEANEEAIRIRPEYYRAHNNLGVALQALGRTEEAVKSYKEALRLRPRFAQAWANLAYAYLRTGDTEEAVRAYEESVARDPANAESRTSLAVL